MIPEHTVYTALLCVAGALLTLLPEYMCKTKCVALLESKYVLYNHKDIPIWMLGFSVSLWLEGGNLRPYQDDVTLVCKLNSKYHGTTCMVSTSAKFLSELKLVFREPFRKTSMSYSAVLLIITLLLAKVPRTRSSKHVQF